LRYEGYNRCGIDNVRRSDYRPEQKMSESARELIGRRIREEREKAGFANQGEFADGVGLHPTALSRIETGQRGVDSVVLQRIAGRLEVPIDTLVREPKEQVVLARQGDGDDEAMGEMIGWTDELLADMDTMARFVGRRPLL
jgi:transcriptional regulator with XRE-family HTH domain